MTSHSLGIEHGPDDESPLRQDPKQLYRELDELLDGTDAGAASDDVVTVFVDRLLERLGETLGLTAGASYEERRLHFQLLDSKGLPSASTSCHGFAASFPIETLQLTRETPYDMLPGLEGAPWLAEASVGGSGAALVGVGRARFVVAISFRDAEAAASADLVLHALRSVLTAHLQRARWGSTMRQAAAIQRSLLPARSPDMAGYDLAGVCIPAEEVGGDFFDTLPVSDTSTGLVIGDASGHGLPAALVARDVIVGLRMGVARELRIAPILEKLNKIIHRGGPSSSFVSLFYGELETNGNLFYVNAGHKAPLLFRGSDPTGTPPYTLSSGDIVLGPVPDARFKRQYVHVDRGDCLVLYTDGVNERLDPPGEQFGDERLAGVVHAVRDRPSAEIAQAVIDAAARFGGGTKWTDDATVLVVKRHP